MACTLSHQFSVRVLVYLLPSFLVLCVLASSIFGLSCRYLGPRRSVGSILALSPPTCGQAFPYSLSPNLSRALVSRTLAPCPFAHIHTHVTHTHRLPHRTALHNITHHDRRTLSYLRPNAVATRTTHAVRVEVVIAYIYAQTIRGCRYRSSFKLFVFMVGCSGGDTNIIYAAASNFCLLSCSLLVASLSRRSVDA